MIRCVADRLAALFYAAAAVPLDILHLQVDDIGVGGPRWPARGDAFVTAIRMLATIRL